MSPEKLRIWVTESLSQSASQCNYQPASHVSQWVGGSVSQSVRYSVSQPASPLVS